MTRLNRSITDQRRSPRNVVPRYLKCNASAFMSARSCVLQNFFGTFLELPAPPLPMTALGTAVHALFEKSLRRHKSTGRYPYGTSKKLIGAWYNYWTTAAFRPESEDEKKKAHGFGGYREPWHDMPWVEYPEEPERIRQQGCAIMAMFFKTFDPIRQRGVPIWVERSFAFWWQNMYWTGRIDVIVFEPDGAVIIDHKPSDYSEPVRRTGPQTTLYQLAYEILFRRLAPEQMPLKAIRVYNYKSGRFQDVPLRDDHEFGMLLKFAREYTMYYGGALHGIVPPPELRQEFHFFNPNDIILGDVTPQLLRGRQCDYCPYIQQCQDWEHGRLPTAREQFRRHLAATSDEMPDEQLRIPFKALPVVQEGRSGFAVRPIPINRQMTLEFTE